jgi:hypothetical protein
MPRKKQIEENTEEVVVTPEEEQVAVVVEEQSDQLEPQPEEDQETLHIEEGAEEVPVQEGTPEQLDQDRVIRLIENIENDVRALKQLVTGTMPARVDHALHVASSPVGFMQNSHDAGLDGIFDGERMVGSDGKGYQVPPNYASKSKLVEGDPLKLYITRDGKYVYKQLGPVDRRTVPGTLRLEGSHYVVDSDEGESYDVLTACVTYYMSLYGLQPGGRVMALIPTARPARWAVIDNVL